MSVSDAAAVTEAEIDAMTDEQVTLHLARNGHSPEDVRRAYERTRQWLEPSIADLKHLDNGRPDLVGSDR
jgi:hypothetical protein